MLPEIVLSGVTMNYNTPKDHQVGIDASFAFPGADLTGECVFVAEKKTAWEFVAVASLGRDHPIDIGCHLPLVGKDLVGDFELKAGYLVIASKDAAGITVDQFPDLTIKPGISFAFDLVLAGQPHTVMLPVRDVRRGRLEPGGRRGPPGRVWRQQRAGHALDPEADWPALHREPRPQLHRPGARVFPRCDHRAGTAEHHHERVLFRQPADRLQAKLQPERAGHLIQRAAADVAGEFVNLSQPALPASSSKADW